MVDDKKQERARPEVTDAVRSMDVRTLLGEHRELRLEHEGQVYRLRITANGKLILTK